MRAIDVVRARCPRAQPAYVAAFEAGDPDLAAAGVTTRLRLAHLLAQVFHETGDLTILEESMSYSAARMTQVWPGRFPTVSAALPYAHNPRGLAEKTYGGRMGNGPEGSGDGWRFVGRGLIQCTGRDSYESFGRRLGIPLAAQPELAYAPEWSLKIALAEWTDKGCNALADRNDLVGITKRINGGLIGLDDRRSEYAGLWPLMLREHDATFTATWHLVADTGPAAPQAWQEAAPDRSTEALQQALNRLQAAGLVVDGKAGPATRTAVAAFQAAHHLAVDGLAGPATWAALEAALAG